MKTIYRIPTKNEYGFVEIERDLPVNIQPKEVLEDYHRVLAEYHEAPSGLTAKEVDLILDGWFKGQGVISDLYDKRNAEQDKWFQAIKRSLARVKRSPNEDEII